MAKQGIVHCRVCGGDINRSTMKEGTDWVMPSLNWYYHFACYQDWAKKKKATTDINFMADEAVWKEAVYDYLAKDLKMRIDWPKFDSQWNNFLKKGYTAKGIFFTIRYIYDVKKCDVQKAQGGIGLVGNLYNEGCSYWCQREIENKGICERITQQIFQLRDQKKQVVNKRTKPKKEKIDLAIIAEMEEDE